LRPERARLANVINRKIAIQDAMILTGLTPGRDVRRGDMAIQAGLIRPDFREAQQAGIEHVLPDIISDAAVMRVGLADQSLDVRQQSVDIFQRKSHASDDGDHGLTPLSC
jgi:hypothetical protein